jgi:hypothetical protein
VIQVIIEEALSALGDEGQICIVVQKGQREPIEAYFNEEANEVYHKKPELHRQAERLKYIAKRITFVLQDKQEVYPFNSSVQLINQIKSNQINIIDEFDFFSIHSKQTCLGLWSRSPLCQRFSRKRTILCISRRSRLFEVLLFANMLSFQALWLFSLLKDNIFCNSRCNREGTVT